MSTESAASSLSLKHNIATERMEAAKEECSRTCTIFVSLSKAMVDDSFLLVVEFLGPRHWAVSRRTERAILTLSASAGIPKGRSFAGWGHTGSLTAVHG